MYMPRDYNKNMSYELVDYVKAGNLEMSKKMLENMADPNFISYLEDNHFLLMAANDSNIPLVELLVSHGADIQRALFILHRNMKEKLHTRGYMNGDNYKNIVMCLLDNAMGVDFSGSYLDEDHYCGLDFLEYITDLSNFNFIGISLDGFPITKDTLKRGDTENPIITIDNLSAILDGQRKQSLETKLLTKFEQLGKHINKEGIVNLVPLWRAAQTGDEEAVKIRLSSGIDPNERGYFGSPISTAARFGHLHIVRVLAELPSIKKKDSPKAILEAFYNGHVDIVNYLSAKCEVTIEQLSAKVTRDICLFEYSFLKFLREKKNCRSSDLTALASEWQQIKSSTVKLSDCSFWTEINQKPIPEKDNADLQNPQMNSLSTGIH